MGATVVQRSSLVTYFQVSVVDQLLVFGPRDPPGGKVSSASHFQASQTRDPPVT